MNKSYWLRWLKAAAIRAVKTMAQTAIATIGTAMVLESVSWQMVVSASLLAAVLSVLTSLAGLPEVEKIEPVEEHKETVSKEILDAYSDWLDL